MRKRLIETTNNNDIDAAIDIIYNQNPTTISPTDLVFLLRLGRARSNNQLAYLKLEAEVWVRDNWAKIQKRIKNLN